MKKANTHAYTDAVVRATKKKRKKKLKKGFSTVGEQYAYKKGVSQKEAADYLKFMGTRT